MYYSNTFNSFVKEIRTGVFMLMFALKIKSYNIPNKIKLFQKLYMVYIYKI